MAGARESAARKGREGWRFTLQAPDYFAVMTYLDNAAIRRQVYEAFAVRATEAERDNRPLIARILELRREKAQLLGFANFADLVLEDRMAHTGARAMAFLEDLKAKTEAPLPRGEPGAAGIPPLAGRPGRARAGSPGTWPTTPRSSAPRSTISTRKRCALTSRWSSVVAGLFELVAPPLRHARGRRNRACRSGTPQCAITTSTTRTATFLGGFYADWYPRENKRGGAWMDALITGGPGGATDSARTWA